MQVLVSHQIQDSKLFAANGEKLRAKANVSLRPRCFFPSTDGTRAFCVWDGPSIAAVRELIDGTLGTSARNEYHELDVAHSFGIPA